jgi:hypothetical protein
VTTGGGEGLPISESSTQSWWRDLVTVPTRPVATILVAYVLSITGSILLSAAIASIAPDAEPPDFSWFVGKGFLTVFLLSVFTPIVETLILAGTTSVLLRLMKPKFAIALSSFGWALAHSYQAPIWGLVIWWPFVIFTTLYVVWKQRSLAWGLFMAFAVHALQNLLTAIAIGFPDLLPST